MSFNRTSVTVRIWFIYGGLSTAVCAADSGGNNPATPATSSVSTPSGSVIPLATQPAATPTASHRPDAPSAAPQYGLTGDWGGYRTKLADRGITTNLTLTLDGTKNLRGGLDTAGSVWRTVLDASITLDTKPLLGWEGGTLFADFQYADGPNASDKLVGDVQGIDGLDGVPGTPHQDRTQLAQLWYQQIAFNGVLRIKAGKVDANTEFDNSTTAQPFLHQSAGASATLFTLPTYPDPAVGLNIFWKPREDMQLGFGVYDGSLASGARTGNEGFQPMIHNPGDIFLIAEIDKSWKLGPDRLSGRIGVGGWYSTNKFNRLDGGTHQGTGAPYALLDQAVWRANPSDTNDNRGINVFLMYGYADPAILQFDHNIGGGISWTGLIPGRRNDILGLGTQSIHFGNSFHPQDDFETSYETFYQFQATRWFMIKPDLQYIAHPGGQGTPDALAFTVRFQITF